MSRRRLSGYDNVQFLDEAVEDMRVLAQRSQPVLLEVLRRLKLLDRGELTPDPLHDFAKTGDLSDCGKLVIAVGGEPEYRVVVRGVSGTYEVSEVIAVEDRSGDLPYLLAGIRLGRLDDPVRRSDAMRRIHRIRQQLDD